MFAGRALRVATLTAVVAAIAAGCDVGTPPATPPISAGSAAAPREVNIIAKDWLFLPETVDVVPGETVLLHLVNGGLEIHEFVIGAAAVQDAWERAEAAAAEHPPGPTPVVSVAPELAGLRVVVPSGQRVDVTWTVPTPAEASQGSGSGGDQGGQLLVGCHIPGHWDRGMVVPIRFVQGTPAP